MKTPESKLRDELKKKIKSAPLLWYYKATAHKMSERGIPDVFIVGDGLFIAVEIKAKGKSPTPLQSEVLKKIAVAGGVPFIVSGHEQLHSFILIMERLAHDRIDPRKDAIARGWSVTDGVYFNESL